MDARGLVWLIRHGQSQANAGVATDHPSTIELTDVGRQQAAAAADQIQATPSRVIVSPFVRTLQTARPLLDRLGWDAGCQLVQTWPIQEFTYLSPLRCKGTTVVDRQDWAREYWKRADPDWNDGDGAESFAQLMQRVRWFTQELQSLDGFSVVYGHGMFFKAFTISLIHGSEASGPAMRRFRELESAAPLKNGQIVEIKTGGAAGCALKTGSPNAA
jgi:2,3-bisphosphoglycerate-dependent phosphoglycerate mutase